MLVRNTHLSAGFDAAFNHRDGDLAGQLRDAAGGGVDVVFDNVGGAHLEAAIDVLNVFGRLVLCGYVASDHYRGENLGKMIVRLDPSRG